MNDIERRTRHHRLTMKRFLDTLLLAALLALPSFLCAGEDIDILFLGNSFTQRHDLPDLVEKILEEGDPDTKVNTSRVIYGGQNMFKHSTYYFSQSFIEESTITPEEIAARIERMKGFLQSENPPNPEEWDAHWTSLGLKGKVPFAEIHRHIQSAIKRHEELLANNPKTKWDYVVLQSWRDVSEDPEQGYAKYATKLAKIAQQQGAEVILYMTSPGTQNQKPVSEPVAPEIADRDIAVALELVKRIQPRAVVPVPLAVKMIQTGSTGLVFRYVNDGHPNQTCAYLTANLFYAAFTGKSPEGLAFDTVVENKVKGGKDPDGGEPQVVFSGETKAGLQKMAHETVREFQRLAKGE